MFEAAKSLSGTVFWKRRRKIDRLTAAVKRSLFERCDFLAQSEVF